MEFQMLYTPLFYSDHLSHSQSEYMYILNFMVLDQDFAAVDHPWWRLHKISLNIVEKDANWQKNKLYVMTKYRKRENKNGGRSRHTNHGLILQ